ncbi:MAG: HEAT repeat domain-containing protein [Aggregatilineales bacterium]
MELIPQLIGLIMGILGGYSLLLAARKRYPGLDEFLKRLTASWQPDEATSIEDDLENTPAAGWQIRRDALYALAESDDKQAAVTELIAALNDDDLDVRETAGQILAGMGKEAVPALLEIVTDGRMEARIEATKSLGMIGDAQARQPLRIIAREDQSIWVRVAALEALGRIGGDVLPVLTDALNDSESMIQEAAIRGLQYMDTRNARKLLQQYHIRRVK